jgi:Glutathione-dependent formaldehyde-activating enzyme
MIRVRALTNCHCSVCRKATGASFSTNAHVRSEQFKMISGEDFIDPGFEWITDKCQEHLAKPSGSAAIIYSIGSARGMQAQLYRRP